jgi:hypothetical protein
LTGLRRTVAALALVAVALAAPPAAATFHEISIREVYPGSVAQPDSEYVELQMWSPGQHLVGGHSITTYDATGALAGTTTFSGDVAAGANQSTILAVTPAAAAEFGAGVDVAMAPGQLSPTGGAVCWESIDCLSWGNFSGPLSSPTGAPAVPAGIPNGMALRRTISPGCATQLEAADDRDNSAADFSAVFPSPRSNSVAPSERACGPSGGQVGQTGGQNGQAGRKAPQTTLRRKPPRKTTDRTPSFGFASDKSGSTFQCKLDAKPFKACRTPFSAQRLALGLHTFKVRARDDSGKLDPSPASYRFKVILNR